MCGPRRLGLLFEGRDLGGTLGLAALEGGAIEGDALDQLGLLGLEGLRRLCLCLGQGRLEPFELGVQIRDPTLLLLELGLERGLFLCGLSSLALWASTWVSLSAF